MSNQILTIATKENYFHMWTSEFYDKYIDDESLETEYFQSIAIGFFIAKGLNVPDSKEMYSYCISKNKF